MQTSMLTYRARADVPAGSLSTKLEIEALRTSVNDRLRVLVPRTRADQHRLRQAIHSALLAPGKRLRPLFVILAARDLGQRAATVLDVGCALEMVHTASLLLDDLPCMDDAKLRRGAPATHILYGESTAMLAAIGMLSRAFEVISTMPDISSDVRAQLVSLLARAVGTSGLVGGQFYDLYQQNVGDPLQQLASTGELKTGALFVAAVDMVSTISDSTDLHARALRKFAAELGLAFQLLDDLLDVESTVEVLGKDVGQDAGKATLPDILGRHGARERLRHHLAAMDDALASVDGGNGWLRSLKDLIFRNIPALHVYA
jgi:geranylgeranyl diphosphate synthase, type II